MKKKLTISEFARMGGKARAAKLTAARRKEIASVAEKRVAASPIAAVQVPTVTS